MKIDGPPPPPHGFGAALDESNTKSGSFCTETKGFCPRGIRQSIEYFFAFHPGLQQEK